MPKASSRSKSARKASRTSKAKKSTGTRKATRKKTATRSSRPSASARHDAPHTLLFPDFEAEVATTRRMLERIPNGNEDWRPHAKSRTLGELATHVAQLPGFGILMTTANEFDGLAGRRTDPAPATSADRVRMFDQLSAQLRTLLQQMTWDQANATWTLRLGPKVVARAPRSNIIRSVFITHSAHHRAQLGLYLRMLETPVPWSYGRSADEEPPGSM